MLEAGMLVGGKHAARGQRRRKVSSSREPALGDACMRRGWAIEEVELKRVADDPKAFVSRYGRFARELAKPEDFGASGDGCGELGPESTRRHRPARDRDAARRR
jgi:hypothetical protein